MEIAQTVSVDSARTTSSSSSPSTKNVVNSNAPPRKYEIDDDEKGDVCRICRNPGDSENPLWYPCACSGSIKFVHQDCLLQWLNHSTLANASMSVKASFKYSPKYYNLQILGIEIESGSGGYHGTIM